MCNVLTIIFLYIFSILPRIRSVQSTRRGSSGGSTVRTGSSGAHLSQGDNYMRAHSSPARTTRGSRRRFLIRFAGLTAIAGTVIAPLAGLAREPGRREADAGFQDGPAESERDAPREGSEPDDGPDSGDGSSGGSSSGGSSSGGSSSSSSSSGGSSSGGSSSGGSSSSSGGSSSGGSSSGSSSGRKGPKGPGGDYRAGPRTGPGGSKRP